jgi:hypothetical protein
MRRRLLLPLLGALLLATSASSVLAASPVVKTEIWLDGELVRTLLPPSPSPNEGTDNFYMVPGTGGVAGDGPGDVGYHGGHWKVYVVSWNVDPYPLTSEEAILAAAMGADPDITITRRADLDFLCPIQGH